MTGLSQSPSPPVPGQYGTVRCGAAARPPGIDRRRRPVRSRVGFRSSEVHCVTRPLSHWRGGRVPGRRFRPSDGPSPDCTLTGPASVRPHRLCHLSEPRWAPGRSTVHGSTVAPGRTELFRRIISKFVAPVPCGVTVAARLPPHGAGLAAPCRGGRAAALQSECQD
eukprot:686899-Hanusia_phi.AAC.5